VGRWVNETIGRKQAPRVSAGPWYEGRHGRRKGGRYGSRGSVRVRGLGVAPATVE